MEKLMRSKDQLLNLELLNLGSHSISFPLKSMASIKSYAKVTQIQSEGILIKGDLMQHGTLH